MKWQIKIQGKDYENLDIIKKASVVKKLEETLDITTDDSLLEKDVHDWMTSKTYCMEKLTILAKYSEKAEEKVHQKYKDKSLQVLQKFCTQNLKKLSSISNFPRISFKT